MTRASIPFRLIEDNSLSIEDVIILRGLCDGKTYKQIAEEAGVSEKVVNDRISSMEQQQILIKRSVPLIDISKIWNHIYMGQIKLQLATPVRLAGVSAPPAWKEILRKIKENPRVSPLFNKLVRMAFIPFGTEYDVILIVTAQSLDEYSTFFEELQKEHNIERVWGAEAVPLGGLHFSPVYVPDIEEIEKSLDAMLESRIVTSHQKRKK